MRLETFFEKFDRLVEVPNATTRLRDLIAELAVRGRLLDQVPTDEPAAVLIERIAFKRRAMSSKDYGFLAADEAPHEIPSSWSWVLLGNIALTSDSGWSPQCLPEARAGTAWGVLKVSAVSWGAYRPDENKALPPGVEARPDCEVKPGDFLLSRANTEELVARSVVVDQTPPRLMMSDKIVRFTFPDEVERRFVHLANLSRSARSYYAANASGTSSSMKNIAREVMCRLPIPLPPLAEQRRIVAKVDELMALCDRLEAQQQERQTRHAALARASLARFAEAPTPANLNLLFHGHYEIEPSDLRRSILTLAIRGKLVHQDPMDEPADRLLLSIGEQREALLQSQYPNRDESATQLRKQSAQFVPEGLEPVAPGWAWATLLQCSLLVVDCHNKTAPYVDSGVRLLRTTNIRDGSLNLDDPRYVSEVTYERWSARCRPEPGDVLITREAPMGEVCIIPAGMRVCLGQRMMLIRLVAGTMDTRYLLYSLLAPDLMDRVQDKPVGATVQHLRVGGVETLLVPVPPANEQRRIVAKVDQLMALIDALESKLESSRLVASMLLNAVAGELATA